MKKTLSDYDRRSRPEQLDARKDADAALQAGALPLNCAPSFWPIYRERAGMLRRRSLVALFKQYPESQLPVNNKWQANTVDPDLQYLLKRGVLVRFRDGGGRRHPMNRSSHKRQTYLVLAPAYRLAD